MSKDYRSFELPLFIIFLYFRLSGCLNFIESFLQSITICLEYYHHERGSENSLKFINKKKS